MMFLSSADFFKIYFLKNFFQEHYQSIKQIGSRSGPTLRRPDLGLNWLQRSAAGDKIKFAKLASCLECVHDNFVLDTVSCCFQRSHQVKAKMQGQGRSSYVFKHQLSIADI